MTAAFLGRAFARLDDFAITLAAVTRPSRPTAPATSLWQTALAGLGCAIVLLLGALHHSPDLHAWLHGGEIAGHASTCDGHGHHHGHGHDHDAPAPTPDPSDSPADADHVCAVTLFASGVLLEAPLAPPAPSWQVVVLQPLAPESAERELLRAAIHNRGPPALG